MRSGQGVSAMDKDPSRTPTSMREPATSLDSGVLGQRIRKSMTGEESLCTMDKRGRKTSMIKKLSLPSLNQNCGIRTSQHMWHTRSSSCVLHQFNSSVLHEL